ncbi:HMG-box domain-containing protein [Larkinella bovis]|uniref:HMG-box domain-containing protein n=1 Tax=Larkinella bovis TaxID=683041 RepID=A0ABW0IC06_9BACT
MKLFWIKRGLGFLAFGLLFVALAGFVVMHLWNWLVPVLFAGPVISFGQALGLLLLSRILVGFRGGGWRGPGWGRSGHPGHPYWREKLSARWQDMTPEERQQFKQQMKEQWRSYCGPRGFGHGRRWSQEPEQPANPPEPTATQF